MTILFYVAGCIATIELRCVALFKVLLITHHSVAPFTYLLIAHFNIEV